MLDRNFDDAVKTIRRKYCVGAVFYVLDYAESLEKGNVNENVDPFFGLLLTLIFPL